MKFELLLVGFCIFNRLVYCEEGLASFSSGFSSCLAEAVAEIVEKFFTRFEGSLHLISECNRSSHVEDFRDALLSRVHSNNLLTIGETNEIPPDDCRKRYAIFIVENFAAETMRAVTPATYRTDGFFAIVFLNKTVNRREVFSVLWENQFSNVIAISESKTRHAVVETFMPFSSRGCKDTRPITINKFVNGKFINDPENIFPDKLKNLFGCIVGISISNLSEPSVMNRLTQDGNYELTGGDINIVKTLAHSLNFRINFTYFEKEGEFYANGSSSGPLRALRDGEVELSISDWWLKFNRIKFFDYTTPYISEPLVFIIPPGRDFTTFEKLLFPFSTWVWAIHTLFFIAGFLVIFIIKFRFKNAQNLVFGTGVKDPYLNIIVGSVGGSQKVLPKRNFARFILMMFLIYSLVMRTLYQASFFHLLQSNKHQKELQSINQIIEEDYTIYTFLGIADLFQGTEAMAAK